MLAGNSDDFATVDFHVLRHEWYDDGEHHSVRYLQEVDASVQVAEVETCCPPHKPDEAVE